MAITPYTMSSNVHGIFTLTCDRCDPSAGARWTFTSNGAGYRAAKDRIEDHTRFHLTLEAHPDHTCAVAWCDEEEDHALHTGRCTHHSGMLQREIDAENVRLLPGLAVAS